MSTHPLVRSIALLLVIVLIAPMPLLLAPQQARAQIGITNTNQILDSSPTGIKTTIETTFTAIKSAITAVASVATQVSTYALMIDKYVLEPIAFITSGNLLKAITASVLKFINGQTNGTGLPQFVQNLRGNLQGVGDTQALAFFAQFGGNSNSPFATAITSSLRTNYLQQTSVGGFFAANRCTLSQFSPNIKSFLAGNWSQGGTGAWFALTTQCENNPYCLHQRAQAELYTLVSNASAARLSELGWGNGFLSWCGTADSYSKLGGTAPAGTPATTPTTNSGVAGQVVAPSSGSAPATCTNKDGSPGFIQTPGSVIGDSLNKALNFVNEKLIQMGSVGPEINSILGSIATVMNTVNFATQLLGGSSGGLASVGNTSSTGSSRLSQFETGSGFLGVTQGTINNGAAGLPSANDMATRVNQYEAYWNTISTAAQTASTSVQNLSTTCAAQSNAAQTALINEIAPVLTKVTAAKTQIANARAMIVNVQNDLNTSDDQNGSGGAYSADVQALQAMPPTAADLAQAEQDAQISNTAQANPNGSLTVSGSSIADEMNLIASNAHVLANACFVVPIL